MVSLFSTESRMINSRKHMRFGFRQTSGGMYKASFNYLVFTDLSKHRIVFQEGNFGEAGFFNGES